MKPRGQFIAIQPRSLQIKEKLLKLRNVSMTLLSSISSTISTRLASLRQRKAERNFEFPERRSGGNFKKYLPYAVLGFFGLLFLAGLSWGTYHIFKSIALGNKVSILGAKASQELNNEFSFSLYNEEGEEVSKLRFNIEKAELRDEIIVKGQRARSVSGRTFLVFNLKITNDYTLPMTIQSKDYLRLSVNDNGEWLAPDVHSDPIEVQSQSTKITRVGFAINDSDKNLKVRVGEINGEKQEIALSLK